MVSSAPYSENESRFLSPGQPGTHEVFVSKKQKVVDVETSLEELIAEELGIPGVAVKIANNYVAGSVSGAEFDRALPAFLAELPVDEVYTAAEFNELTPNSTVLRIEANPGQYSPRVDFLNRCFAVQEVANPQVRFFHTFALSKRDGSPLLLEEAKKIEKYLVNVVEQRNVSAEARYVKTIEARSPEWHDIIGGFGSMSEQGLEDLVKAKEIPLELPDLVLIQKYFKDQKRDPTLLELLVLATYWSDHCRHTTFTTHIDLKKLKISPTDGINKGYFDAVEADIQKSIAVYHDMKRELGRSEKPVTFMDIVSTPPKRLKQLGIENMRRVPEMDEINAFTYETEIELENGKKEKYLVMFKNETHNSPTQVAPFGGAATCFGGCVRDIFANRGFAFYAMRVSGSADPTEPLDQETIGFLSQRFISQFSALGHASYANQMGTAAGVVDEYFSEGYRAKHFECGYLIGYAPKDAVRIEQPKEGDKVIQFGGYVGRDGFGGATTSSAGTGARSEAATVSHVQGGRPDAQSAIQSLMLDTEFVRLIKRSNDFGAGGISVAGGEIAPGVDLYLHKQKVKYTGLTAEELAICESQERMAIVISPENFEKAQEIALKYGLELTEIGLVTSNDPKTGRVRMFRGEDNVVMDMSREFLDSAGAVRTQEELEFEVSAEELFIAFGGQDQLGVRARFLANLRRKEVGISGVGRGFDNSIGATVQGMFGGKTQMSPEIAGVALIPTFNRNVDGEDTNPRGVMSKTAVANAVGFALTLLKKNSYIGAQYSIIEFVSKMVAVGVKRADIYYGLQEYFEKLGTDSKRWGKIGVMLLGAVRAMFELQLAAIGGKDSASGSGKKKDGQRLDVPPTLVALGNGTLSRDRVVSAQLKKDGNTVVYFPVPKNEHGIPNWEQYQEYLEEIESLHDNPDRPIKSSSVVKQGGVVATLAKMAIGNQIGFTFDSEPNDDYYRDDYGGIVIEVSPEVAAQIQERHPTAISLGTTKSEPSISLGDTDTIPLDEIQEALTGTLESVYPTKPKGGNVPAIKNFTASRTNDMLVTKRAPNVLETPPLVLIPAFPGTNSHHDTAQAARRAGFINTRIIYFNTQNPTEFKKSVSLFVNMLKQANVTVFPGGFSGGDEPDGSAKYIAMLMRMNEIKDVLQDFLDRPTLTLGICNGFQLLMKLGVFSGESPKINDYLGAEDMTLTYNDVHRHVTDSVGLIIRSTQSPWLSKVKVGDTFVLPISHGEGRMFASEAELQELIKNGQVAIQYLDENGKPTNKYNGSVAGIAAITDKKGQVFGLMPHPERAYKFLYQNIPGNHHLPLMAGAAEAFGVSNNLVEFESGLWLPEDELPTKVA